MAEQSDGPDRESLPKTNKIALVADTALGTAFVAGGIADKINNVLPHSFDNISLLIENHVGNFPASVGVGLMFAYSAHRFLTVCGSEEAENLRKYIPLATLVVTIGVNMIVESYIHPGPESLGDVVSGSLGGVVAAAHMALPDKIELLGARFIIKTLKESKKYQTTGESLLESK